MDEYLQSIVNVAPILQQAATDCNQEWEPEVPPITLLYSAVGRAIARAFKEFDPATRQYLFTRIEFGMNSSDSRIGDAVATGLLEALATQVFNNRVLLDEILSAALPESRKYLEWCVSENV